MAKAENCMQEGNALITPEQNEIRQLKDELQFRKLSESKREKRLQAVIQDKQRRLNRYIDHNYQLKTQLSETQALLKKEHIKANELKAQVVKLKKEAENVNRQ